MDTNANVPTELPLVPQVLLPDRPAVVLAVEALRTFGGEDLLRDGALLLLPHWYRYDELSQQHRDVVLRRFPLRPHPLADATEPPPPGAT